jgi:hypothetical protein
MTTPITPLPTPAPTSTDPSTFDARADALVFALPTLVSQINTFGSEMDSTEARISAMSADLLLAGSVPSAKATSTTTTTVSGLTPYGRTFTIETGRSFLPGMPLLVSKQSNRNIWMWGVVFSYSGDTLVLIVHHVSSLRGTHSDWDIYISGPFGKVIVTDFTTTSGTWTKNLAARYVQVQILGAGGGGGGCYLQPVNPSLGSRNLNPGAGGGGGGGYTELFFADSSVLPSTVAVNVGVGGAGGAAALNGFGGAGGASEFGTYGIAYGGGRGGGSITALYTGNDANVNQYDARGGNGGGGGSSFSAGGNGVSGAQLAGTAIRAGDGGIVRPGAAIVALGGFGSGVLANVTPTDPVSPYSGAGGGAGGWLSYPAGFGASSIFGGGGGGGGGTLTSGVGTGEGGAGGYSRYAGHGGNGSAAEDVTTGIATRAGVSSGHNLLVGVGGSTTLNANGGSGGVGCGGGAGSSRGNYTGGAGGRGHVRIIEWL